MMSWFMRLALISNLGTDAVMIYEALSMKDAQQASAAFVNFVAHVGHLLGIKELSDERIMKYKASLQPIVTDLLSDMPA